MRSADATRGCAGGGGPRAVCAPSAARAGRSGDPRHIAVPAWSRMFARSALVCGMETGKKCSSWYVGSRSIFNLLVRMDGSFGEENCGIKKKKKDISACIGCCIYLFLVHFRVKISHSILIMVLIL